MKLKCQQVRELLPDLEVLDPGRRELVHHHLSACRECAAEQQEQENLATMFANLPPPPMPPDLSSRIMDAIPAEPPPDRAVYWLAGSCASLFATLAILRSDLGQLLLTAERAGNWLTTAISTSTGDLGATLWAFTQDWLQLVPGGDHAISTMLLWLTAAVLLWAMFTTYQASKRNA